MILKLSSLRYGYCQRDITIKHHFDIIVTSLESNHTNRLPHLERNRVAVELLNNGTWVWSESNKPCSLAVEQTLNDLLEQVKHTTPMIGGEHD